MRKLALSAATVLIGASFGFAQSHPNFGGTWVRDATKPAAQTSGTTQTGGTTKMSGGVGRATLSGGGPIEYRITQTDTTLTIERHAGSTIQKFVHTFDGAENVNVNGRTTLKTKSRWEGSRLITEGTQTVAAQSGEITATVREVRTVGEDGLLVVETTRTSSGDPSTTKQVYRRKEA
jgi:hypothetical protein